MPYRNPKKTFSDLHVHSKELIGEPEGAYFKHELDPVLVGSLERLMESMQEHFVVKKGSDGSLTTTQILNLAKEKGLGAISIVDHWNLKAIPHTMIWALENKAPLYISGMECRPDYLDITYKIKLPAGAEFLAYYFNPDDKRLNDFVNHRMYSDLIRRAHWLSILKGKIGNRGVDLPSFEECLNERNFEKNPLANKQALFDYIKSRNNGRIPVDYVEFSSILKLDDDSHENERPKFSFTEFAALVHGAGGIAGIAHPLRWLNLSIVEEVLKTGLCDFIEAKYNYAAFLKRKPGKITDIEGGLETISRLVEKYDLPISGGSDDHDGSLIGIEGISRKDLRKLAMKALSRHGLEYILTRGSVNESLTKISTPLLLQKKTGSSFEYLMIQMKESSFYGDWTFPTKITEQVKDIEEKNPSSEEELLYCIEKNLDLRLEREKLIKIPYYGLNTNGPIIYFNVPFFYRADKDMEVKRRKDGYYIAINWMSTKELRSVPNLHPEAKPIVQHILGDLESGVYRA